MFMSITPMDFYLNIVVRINFHFSKMESQLFFYHLGIIYSFPIHLKWFLKCNFL